MAERDPALPSLRLLLDDGLLSQWLSVRLEEDVVALRSYLRYKPGTACLATVHLGPPGGRTLMVGHWAASARPKLHKVLDRADAGWVLVHDAAAGLLVTTPAADRHLPALRRLEQSGAAARVRAVAGLDRRRDARLTCTTLSFKPERRWVGRADLDEGDQVLLRAYRRGHLETHTAHLRVLQGRAPVAHLLGVDGRDGLAAVEWVPGRQLSWHDDRAALPDVGAVLASLHAVPASTAPRAARAATVDDLARALRGTGRSLVTLLPDERERTSRAVTRAVRALGSVPRDRPTRLVHGDLSADQVVIEPGGAVRLIDLDRARPGVPAEDLASLLATAGLDGLDADALVAGTAQGYPGAPPPQEVAAYAAEQVLVRAVDAFRGGQVDWPDRSRAALRRAETLLDRAEAGS